MTLSPLPPAFYQRSVVAVARDLLGARLVRRLDGQRVSGWIVETEAYEGESDLACHARFGRTPRNEVMYGPAGRAYVYFIYGMHWMLNVVTGPEDDPNAVLIRALIPVEGLNFIARNRKTAHPRDWTNGPARLCQALEIDRQLNGADFTDSRSELTIELGIAVSDADVLTGPRVGIESVPEPWRSIPWRFRAAARAIDQIRVEALPRASEENQ
jgi:DNA-3-methyladenine glycosylase